MFFIIINLAMANYFSFSKTNLITCASNEYLVHGHFRKGYTKSDGTVVKATTVKNYCKERSAAYEFANKLFTNEPPKGWPHKSEKSLHWSNEKKQKVIDAIELIPNQLLVNKLKGIYLFDKSKDFPNPGSSAEGIIVLYNTAFDESRNLSRIITHELAHQLYYSLAAEQRLGYGRAGAEWDTKLADDHTIYWVPRETGYVENDGRHLLEEDYANNLEYFLFDSDTLKTTTPKAYQWIKKNFGESFKLKGGK